MTDHIDKTIADEFINGSNLLPIGTEVYELDTNTHKIHTFKVIQIRICNYNRDVNNHLSYDNHTYDIEYEALSTKSSQRLVLTKTNLNKYLFLTKEDLYKSLDEE